jgi:spore coat protein U-like protein
MVRLQLRGAVLIALLAISMTPARAETSKSFQVSADIVKGCVVATNGAGQWGKIDFGTVSGVAQGTVDADLVSGTAGGIQIDCTPSVNASVTADTGDHAASGMRRMGLNGASATTIPYQLYANGSATPWTTQAIALSFSTGATRRVLPIKGRASLNRAMTGGAYTDTVRVTVTW